MSYTCSIFRLLLADFYQEGKGASSSATSQGEISQASQEPHGKSKKAAPKKPLPPQYQVQYSQRSKEGEHHEAWNYEHPTNVQPHQLHMTGYSSHVQPAAMFQEPSYLQLGHSEEDLYSLEPLVIPQLQPPLPPGQTSQSSSYAASSSAVLLPSLPPTYEEVSSLPQPGIPTTHHNPYDHPPY